MTNRPAGTGLVTEASGSKLFPSLDIPGGWAGGVPGTRRAAFAWGNGGEAIWTTILSDAQQRLPIVLPVSTTRWRLRVGNNDAFGNLIPGVIAFTGVYVGTPVVDATTSAVSGAFTAAPAQALGAFNTPADGSDYTSAWVTDPALQFTARKNALVSMGWTKAGATNIANGSGSMWYSNSHNDAAVAAPSLTSAGNIGFSPVLEYEFAGGQRVGIALGDSLTEGKGAGLSIQRWHQQLSMRTGLPIASTAKFGTTAAQWGASSAIPGYQRVIAAGLTLDFAIVQLGINDVTVGGTLATYQASIGTIVNNIRTLFGVRDVYLNTIAPKGATGATETLRASYNAWLRTSPLGTRGVWPVDDAVASSAGGTTLNTDSDSGDGLHWNTVGNWRVANAVRV